jgi:hypothetical protein
MYFFAMPAMDWYSASSGTSGLYPGNPLLKHNKAWLEVADMLNFHNIVDALMTLFQVANVVRHGGPAHLVSLPSPPPHTPTRAHVRVPSRAISRPLPVCLCGCMP